MKRGSPRRARCRTCACWIRRACRGGPGKTRRSGGGRGGEEGRTRGGADHLKKKERRGGRGGVLMKQRGKYQGTASRRSEVQTSKSGVWEVSAVVSAKQRHGDTLSVWRRVTVL